MLGLGGVLESWFCVLIRGSPAASVSLPPFSSGCGVLVGVGGCGVVGGVGWWGGGGGWGGVVW